MPSAQGMKPRSKSELTTGGVHARFSWTPLGRARPTIDSLELRVEPGERVLLLGRSGSGKSTVLHALLGALGNTLSGDFSGEVAAAGRIGFVPQNPSDGIVAETIGRDIAFGPENLGLSTEEIWHRVHQAREAVALPYPVEHLTAALSGGEQQRLTLAGVLAMEPDIMLLDEPTSMLDSATAKQARDAVLAAVGDRTLIVVEHRFEPWLECVDRVIVLEGGAIVSDTSPERLPVLDGLWHPSATLPEPVVLPFELVAPHGRVETVTINDLAVDVVSRRLRGTQKIRALDGVNATFEPGRISSVIGPSGAGKSTLLLAAAGLIKASAGSVTPNRRKLRSRDLAAGLGWVPQNPEHGFLTQSVAAEVAVTARRLGREIDTDAILAAVGLERYAEAHPYRLSGGEQRRLALAAALAHRPGLIALDEPSVGQDPDSWALVAGWMRSAAQAGAVVTAATHDSDLPRDHQVILARRA